MCKRTDICKDDCIGNYIDIYRAMRRAVYKDVCTGVYLIDRLIDRMGVYIDVCMGDHVDIGRAVYRAVYRAVRADNYRAFLVYQCCVLVEL